MNDIKFYEGDKLKQGIHHNEIDLDPYLPAKELVEVVKLAQILQRPLLLKGEPGSGKSRLAEGVAYELHGENYEKNFFNWPIKSNTKAQDGLYIIDHLKRLRDASLKDKDIELDLRLDGPYLSLGKLGQAFRQSSLNGLPPVVLIDEVDKADIDFPNDLLIELDKMQFDIPESNIPTIKAVKRPLIFITSNDEKQLPPAFLRRCLFHYIDPLDADKLNEIVAAKYPGLKEEIRTGAVKKFIELKKQITDLGSNKNISTSELLDWVKIIHYYFDGKEKAPDFNLIPFAAALFKDVETFKQVKNPAAV